jgi:phospholipid/cholesterol/gamma-HCH transport system permease protein
MRVTEQIDAMEVSGTNPFNYVIVTRILATTLMLPLLTVFNDVIYMLGSFTGVNIKDDVSFYLYFSFSYQNNLLRFFVATFIEGYADVT